jgi:cation diffusion facilitator CzcD-associated flavoprotein CzcO
MSTDTVAGHVDVLIIGAGLSGVGVACRIRQEHPGRSIAILERRQRIGGTWDLFRYPGIRSDSDMFTFGYEFRPWDDLKVLADGDAIRAYIAETAAEHHVDRDVHYGLKVLRAEWSSADAQWTVVALDEAGGATQTWTCGFLVTCTGYYDYDHGYQPEFPGVEDYRGQFIHPQHWPEDLDYTDKSVVVIGSGATAVTLVPAMAGTAGHVTMLQRSPSYVFSLPALDKISGVLKRFLPDMTVYRMTRRRNITLQRAIYRSCRRWPEASRRVLLAQVRRQVGPNVDMSHFSPRYDPWDERLCAVPDGDLFHVLADGSASVVTDTIETFTPTGIRLGSGRELDADIVVSATGLQLQMLGGLELYVDGEQRQLHDVMTYKGLLLEGIPNLAWVFGYTNSSWTLKVDIASTYLMRLFRHMDEIGATTVVPRDTENSSAGVGMLDTLHSGYVQRAKDMMPRQGRRHPWKVLMDYRVDTLVLREDPIVDGVLAFEVPARADAIA